MRAEVSGMQNVIGLKPPCRKDCENRSSDCHIEGHCEQYTEYKKKLEEFRASGEYQKYMSKHCLGLSRRFKDV